ncbi:MAG: endonuclease [Candidatus Sumerlaeales bacterium]|nr:endonuclease [Candidatus Sumerlaeales bacterium]
MMNIKLHKAIFALALRTMVPVITVAALNTTAIAAIPTGYYNDAEGKTGAALKTALKTITGKGYNSIGYSSCDEALKYIDEAPSDTSKIYLYYLGQYVSKSSSWNKEHLWPQSRGCSSSPMKSDLHHLFPEDTSLNSSRGNSVFGVVSNPSSTKSGNKWTSSMFEPRDDIKGNVARALLYMETRYADRGFSLVNETNISGSKMGIKSQLIDWHHKDPVDTNEIRRNDRVYSRQKNRNPYIDHPEYVDMVYGTTPTVVHDNDTLSLAGVSVAPEQAGAGTQQAPMVKLMMRANTNEWDLAAIEVAAKGTLPTGQIQAIQLWRDSNNNGTFDGASDLLLGELTTITSSNMTLSIASPSRFTATTTTSLFLTASISDMATSGCVLQLMVTQNSAKYSTTGGKDINPIFTSITSDQCLITKTTPTPPPTGVYVVINKVYNSGSTNDAVELLVLQNGTSLVGHWVKDFSSGANNDNGGGAQFLDIPTWKNLSAGTLIALSMSSSTSSESPIISGNVIRANLNNPSLFDYTPTFDLGSAEIVMIKTGTKAGTTGNIHALGYGFSSSTQWSKISDGWKTLLTNTQNNGYVYVQNSTRSASDYNRNDLAKGEDLTLGKANNTDNQAFINSLTNALVSEWGSYAPTNDF